MVHDLKSESGMLGATRLSNLAGRIQKAARAGEAVEVREAVALLKFEADRACAELHEILLASTAAPPAADSQAGTAHDDH